MQHSPDCFAIHPCLSVQSHIAYTVQALGRLIIHLCLAVGHCTLIGVQTLHRLPCFSIYHRTRQVFLCIVVHHISMVAHKCTSNLNSSHQNQIRHTEFKFVKPNLNLLDHQQNVSSLLMYLPGCLRRRHPPPPPMLNQLSFVILQMT